METERNLRTRLKEHKYAVKRNDDRNGIAVHAQRSGHRVDWESEPWRVIAMEDHTAKRKVLEAIAIQESECTSNLDVGLTLNPIWRPLLKTQPPLVS